VTRFYFIAEQQDGEHEIGPVLELLKEIMRNLTKPLTQNAVHASHLVSLSMPFSECNTDLPASVEEGRGAI
jgi:hypothetical protein